MGCFYSFLNKTGCQILTYSSFLLIRKMKLIGIHRLSRSFPPKNCFCVKLPLFQLKYTFLVEIGQEYHCVQSILNPDSISPYILFLKKWLWFIKKLTRMEYKYTQFSKKKDYPCTYIIMRVPFLLKAGFSCNVWLIKYINFNSNRNNKL